MSDDYSLQKQLIELVKSNGGAMSKKAPSRDTYSHNCHERLNHQQVADGVYLLSRYLGMYGSAGSFDLYRLNQAYLLDPAMREKQNELLRGWQAPLEKKAA